MIASGYMIVYWGLTDYTWESLPKCLPGEGEGTAIEKLAHILHRTSWKHINNNVSSEPSNDGLKHLLFTGRIIAAKSIILVQNVFLYALKIKELEQFNKILNIVESPE